MSSAPFASASSAPGPDAVASAGATTSPLSEEDAAFVAALGSGLTGLNASTAISVAKRTCGAFQEKSTVDDIRAVLADKNISAAQSTRIILAAVTVYCPEFKDRVAP